MAKSKSARIGSPANEAAADPKVCAHCIDTAPYGIRVTDVTGKIVLYNSRLEEITGYSREEMPDLDTYCEKVYPDPKYRRMVTVQLREQIRKSLVDPTGSGLIENRHAMITRKDGSIRNCRILITGSFSSYRSAFFREAHVPGAQGGDADSSATAPEMRQPFFSWMEDETGALVLLGYNEGAEIWAGRSLRGALAAPVGELFENADEIEAELRRSLAGRLATKRKGSFRLRQQSEGIYAAASFGFDAPCIATLQLEDLTDLMRAEESLLEARGNFNELAELLPDLVFEVDPAGRLLYVNRSGARLMGFDPDAYPKGDNVFAYFAPEDRGRVGENFAKVFAGQDIGANEYTMVRRDGSRFTGLLRSSLVRKEGRVVGARGFIIDVSAKKKTEEALAASERKFALSIQNSPNAFTIVRLRDGIFIDVNDACCQLLGRSRDEFIGHTSIDIELYDDPHRREEFFRRIRAQGKLQNFPVVFRRKNGEQRHGLFFASLTEIDGEPCIMGELADVTEIRQTEEALRLSEERLRTATQNATIGLWDWDIRNRKIFVNDMYLQMLGYPPDYAIPSLERWAEMIHPEDRSKAEKTARECLLGKAEDLYTSEYRMRRADGSYLWIHDIGRVAQRDESGVPVRALGIHIDISERKRLEHIQAQYRQELEQEVSDRTSELSAANLQLARQIEKCREAETHLIRNQKLLQKRTEDLEQTNTALKVVLRSQSQEAREIEDRIKANIRKNVIPHLSRLKALNMPAGLQRYLAMAEANLREIASPPVERVLEKLGGLTQTETQVAELIMVGAGTKEIAEALSLSSKTIETHRYNLRRKLGIANKKVNLRAHLKGLK